MLCSTLLPYQNVLTDPLLRCPIALYPSAFDHPSSPSPATQQASKAHDKRDLYNTCIVSPLFRNKYCLNQTLFIFYYSTRHLVKICDQKLSLSYLTSHKDQGQSSLLHFFFFPHFIIFLRCTCSLYTMGSRM